MSIRSLDLQMLVPKSQEQSKINQQDNDKVRMEHQQVIQEDKKETNVNLTRVSTFEENVVYNNNQNSNKRQNNSKKEKQKKENKKGKKSEARSIGSRIDIKI